MTLIKVTIYENPGNHTWNWPDGETEALVEVESADAGGGNPTADAGGAGGSAGGFAYALVSKSSATILDVVVGAGGGPETDGGESSVSQDSSYVCRATGAFASSGLTPGVPGMGIVGDLLYRGGNGGDNNYIPPSLFSPEEQPEKAGAGGGARATKQGGGQDGSRGLDWQHGQGGHGVGGVAGGDGGDGFHDPDLATNGRNGVRGGGGGGGNGAASGSGAHGRVRITCPPPPRGGRCCCKPHISCDDESFDKCFFGKCIQITVAGVLDGICTCCGEIDGVFITPSIGSGGAFTRPICGGGSGVLRHLSDCCGDPPNPDSLYRWVRIAVRISNNVFGDDPDPDCNFRGISGSIEQFYDDPTTFPNTGYVVFGFTAQCDNLQADLDTLCNGGEVVLQYTVHVIGGGGGQWPGFEADNPDYYGCKVSDSATMTIKLVDCPSNSYNCIAGICVQQSDDSGTYPTLTDCLTSPCSYQSSYSCIQGVCVDPHDGSGGFIDLADCIASGCSEADCNDLNDCGPSLNLEVEIGGYLHCNDGTYDWSLENLNHTYTLFWSDPSIFLFYEDLGTFMDPTDRGVKIKEGTDGGDLIQTYVRRIEIVVQCYLGETTQLEVDYYLQTFTNGVYTSDGLMGANPTTSLSATVRRCGSGYMLGIFPYTDCLGVNRSFWIGGAIGGVAP